MKRIISCLLVGLATGIISKAQNLDEVSPRLMAKIFLEYKGANVKGLFHQVTDSSISILRPMNLAKKSVRIGVLQPGAHFTTYKFTDMKSMQFKKKSPGLGAARGFFIGAMLGVPVFLDAIAEDDSDQAIAKGVSSILLTGLGATAGTIVGATNLNFFKLFDSRNVGGSGIDATDVELVRKLASRYKF